MGQLKVVNMREARVVLAKIGKPLPDGRTQIDELVLEGGANAVDESIWVEYMKAPTNEGFLKAGVLRVEGVVTEGKDESLPAYGGDMSKLKLDAALKAIKACSDPRQLRLWMQQDTRQGVRKALIDRHKELDTDKPEEPKDN